MKLARILGALFLVSTAASGCSSCKKDPSGSSSNGSSSNGSKESSTSTTPEDSPPKDEGPSHLAHVHAPKHKVTEWQSKRDAFSFENYGPDHADLSAAEVRRMCGDSSCADLDGDDCVLTPAAEASRNSLNKMMAGGHCEGMALLSVLLQRGMIDAERFGGPNAAALKLEGNEKLQREIAYWFATQFMDPVNKLTETSEDKWTPNDVVAKLKEAIAKDDPQTLGFYMRNGDGGHATYPYALVEKEDGIVWILHYDNNYPGEERHIEVDTKKNTWKYTTSSDPNQPEPDDYEGDATSHTIDLTPLSARTGPIGCLTTGEPDQEGKAKGSARMIVLDGKGDLTLEDQDKHHLGWVNGKLVSEIPDGGYMVVPTGRADEEPVYFAPTGRDLAITIDGAKLKADDSTAITLLGAGYTLGIEDVMLSPGEKDHLWVSGDFGDVEYETEAKETPTLVLGISTPGPDYEIRVRVSGEKPGQKVKLSVDLAKGTFTLLVDGGDGSTEYAVELERIDDKGKASFSHKGLSAAEDKAVVFEYGAWKGDKTPLKIGEIEVSDDD